MAGALIRNNCARALNRSLDVRVFGGALPMMDAKERLESCVWSQAHGSQVKEQDVST
jgi:hypothetical protein